MTRLRVVLYSSLATALFLQVRLSNQPLLLRERDDLHDDLNDECSR